MHHIIFLIQAMGSKISCSNYFKIMNHWLRLPKQRLIPLFLRTLTGEKSHTNFDTQCFYRTLQPLNQTQIFAFYSYKNSLRRVSLI